MSMEGPVTGGHGEGTFGSGLLPHDVPFTSSASDLPSVMLNNSDAANSSSNLNLLFRTSASTNGGANNINNGRFELDSSNASANTLLNNISNSSSGSNTPSSSTGNLPGYINNVLNIPRDDGKPLTAFNESKLPPMDDSLHHSINPSEINNHHHNNIHVNNIPQQQHQQNDSHDSSNTNNKIVPVPTNNGPNYVDITEYLNLPQNEAAKRLGVPTSTLSKRWKEASVNRKWPYRTVCKLDKEIMTLLHNIPQGPGAPPLPPEIEQSLGVLLKKRQAELRTVILRL